MWLSSIFFKTLRDYWIPILGWGIGMGLVVVSPMASVSTLLTTPQAREQLVSLAATFAWNADVVAVDTLGGYATFKIGIFIFLIAVWPLLAASRMLRGEEERGSLDVLLSLPRPRLRVALEKLAALWTALLAMGLLIGLVVFAGGQKFGADFGFSDAVLFGVNLALVCAVIGGLALHPGAQHRGGVDRGSASRLHRPGHGSSRDPQQRMDLAPIARLLLQPQQAISAELRRQCRSDTPSDRAEPHPGRDVALAVRSSRHWRDGTGAPLAPAGGAQTESSAAGHRLVAAFRLRARPRRGRNADPVVDVGDRGLRRLDRVRRPTDGNPIVQLVLELAHRDEPDQEYWRWRR